MGGVDGLDEAEASPSEFVIVSDCKSGADEDVGILGGRSSSSASASPLSFVSVFEVVVEFWEVVLVFVRENHPDFFGLSPSRTTIRSSVKSGSYKVDKHAG